MPPSIGESKEHKKKSTIEEQAQDGKEEKVMAPTQEEVAVTPPEPTKKKKKKKKDSPSAADATSEKENGAATKGDSVEKDGASKPKKPATEDPPEKEKPVVQNDPSKGPVVSATKRTRPQYKYDPEKITLRFLFANKDGLTVTVECKPTDTVGTVKGQLLSVWPEDLQSCTGGDQLRLICMGKGVLMPDTRTLHDCEVPVFKTHPTPVNVAVRPKQNLAQYSKSGKDGGSRGGGSSGGSGSRTMEQSGQGCGCVIS